MKLVIGGSHQGKLDWVQEQFHQQTIANGADCSTKELLEKPVIWQFHLWVRRMLKESVDDVQDMVRRILEQNPDVIIISDEIGCGVVPMEPFERHYREEVGRICCKLAKQAKQVYRVTCGVAVQIK